MEHSELDEWAIVNLNQMAVIYIFTVDHSHFFKTLDHLNNVENRLSANARLEISY